MRLRRYVAGCAAVSVVLVALVLGATGLQPTSVPPPWMIVFLWLAVAVSSTVRFTFASRGSGGTASTLNELGLVPAVVLLEPVIAIPVVVTAYLVGELSDRGRPPIRHVFNVSAQTGAVAVAGGLFHLVVDGFSVSPAALSMGLLAAGIVVGVNLVTIIPIASIMRERPLRHVVREFVDVSVSLDLGTAAVGLLAAVLLVAAPLALPLLLLPALLYRGQAEVLTRSLDRLEAERERFERTVAGASDGVVLAGPGNTVEVWNPAMERLSGLPREAVQGERLADVGWEALGELASDGDGSAEHVEVGGRALEVRHSPLTEDGRTVFSVRDISRERELGRIREELVSRISHELRTPLTSVEGFLETLAGRWDELEPGMRHQLAVAAARGAGRLSVLVDNLLTWSQIEARTSHASRAEERDAADLLEVVARVHAAYEQNTVRVSDELRNGNARVAMTDADLTAVVEHLVRNAELYGAPPVTLAISEATDWLRLTVTDHGVGLPPGFAAEAFQPFRQGVEGLQRTGRGLGLGLAIVHSLVVGCGGEVSLEQPEHRGARFVVSLPRIVEREGT